MSIEDRMTARQIAMEQLEADLLEERLAACQSSDELEPEPCEFCGPRMRRWPVRIIEPATRLEPPLRACKYHALLYVDDLIPEAAREMNDDLLRRSIDRERGAA